MVNFFYVMVNFFYVMVNFFYVMVNVTLPGKNKQKSTNEFVIHELENINRDLVLLGISDTHNKFKLNSPCMHTFKLILC